MTYWILKRKGEYLQATYGALGPRLNAYRCTNREEARRVSDLYTPPLRLVRVTTRPRSERSEQEEIEFWQEELDRCQANRDSIAKDRDEAVALLAAWEPTIRAAEEMRKRWDERSSPAKQQDAQIAVVVACRAIPEEHRL